MFSFAYRSVLFLLLLIPAVLLLYLWSRYSRNKKLSLFGKSGIIRNLMPDVSKYKPVIRITIQLLAIFCLIIALARPWGGVKNEKTTKEGIEVIIAFDVSNSMLAPTSGATGAPSRIRTAKLMLERLINKLHNDRVGLIVYTSEAYTLIPVTNDYVSAKVFMNTIDTKQYKTQGTNIASAIDLAVSSFKQDKRTGKAIILVTDAEELENPDAAMESVSNAAKNGIQVDVIGVGSTTPVKIPFEGTFLINPETGAPVETVLNEDLAQKIASKGKGIYVNASNSDALNELSKQLGTLKKTTLESSLSAVHDELFWIFVVASILLIALDMLLLERKNEWLAKFNFFKKE